MKAAKISSTRAALVGRPATSASEAQRTPGVARPTARRGPATQHPHIAIRRLWWKRGFDLVFGCLFLLLALPVLGVAALAILIEDRGDVFFFQERIGRGGRSFRIVKLRTMRPPRPGEERDQPGGNGPFIKVKGDERITRVGRWLRTWAVDELPQLFNVWRGEMSLVGPRPFVGSEMAHCRPEQWQRLSVRPGMTGLAQISGSADLNMEQIVAQDLRYAENCSPLFDAVILLKTLGWFLGARRGMY